MSRNTASEAGRGRTHTAGVFAALAFVAIALLIGTRPDARAGVVPPNDDLARPYHVDIPISPLGTAVVEYTNVQSTIGATLEEGETSCLVGAGATVWYVYDPAYSGTIVVDTTGSDYATAVGVYVLTGFSPPGPGSPGLVVCGGAPGSQAVVSFDATAHRLYAIQVAGVEGATGTLRIRVSCEPLCPPPNDNIGTPAFVGGLPLVHELSTAGATLEAGEQQPCGNIGKTVWYRLDSFGSQGDTIAVSGAAAGFSPVIAVYSLEPFTVPSPPGGLRNLSCDAAPSNVTDLTASFVTEPSRQYFIQVGGVDGAGGAARVDITCDGATCAQLEPPRVDPVETGGEPGTGGDAGQGGGGVRPPGTGSGGYR